NAGFTHITSRKVKGPASSISIDTSDSPAGSFDSVHVFSTGVAVEIKSDVGNTAQVTLGNSAHGVQDITGTVTVSNFAHRTSLIVGDRGDDAPWNATLKTDPATGRGVIVGTPPSITRFEYVGADLTSLEIRGGDKGNTFDVQDTTVVGGTTIYAGSNT